MNYIEPIQSDDEPFLPPIEKPSSLMMKIAYYFTKRKLGKVISPLKIHSVRLPFAFARFYTTIPNLDKKVKLPLETVMLIRERVARINVCNFCIDNNRAFIIMESMNQEKFHALENYQTDPLFSDEERALLNYVTQLTKEKKVTKTTFDQLQMFFSEREICEIVYIVASEHLYNMTNIGLNINSDLLCDIALKKQNI